MTKKKQPGAVAKIVILLLALSIASVAATQVLAWRWASLCRDIGIGRGIG